MRYPRYPDLTVHYFDSRSWQARSYQSLSNSEQLQTTGQVGLYYHHKRPQ